MEFTRSETSALKSSAVLPLPRETIYKGLLYFSIFTIAGLAVLAYATSTRQTLTALSHLEVRFLGLAAILQFLDIGLGAWRNHILVQKFKPEVKPWLCFKAQLANEFAAAVTPGQGGGGPAWLYILHRGGIPLTSAIAVSVIVFLCTLVFFQITTSLSVLVIGGRFSSQAFQYLLMFGFCICTGLFLFILFTLCLPNYIHRLIAALTRLLRSSRQPWRERLAWFSERLAESINQYHGSCMLFFRNHRVSVFQTFLMTGMYSLIKLHLAYVILLGLGVSISYLPALAVLALLRFILYFTPTPGGSGVGELVIAALMSTLMPLYLLPLFTIIYRFFQLFLPATFGAWVLFSELRTVVVK